MFYDQHVCGARIQELRKSKGYTQEALAEAIDIDAKRISNYHGFIRASNMGLSVTGGFRIGYIIPDKCTKTKKK